ncbi:MAG: hypothetical protein CMN30_10955 [Sandaracinus sp.]|nr:hypothetical protein [Sandaracinus sp.]
MDRPNIIVGMDLSENGERALAQALRLARPLGATVHLAHAITKDELASPGDAMERQDAAFGRLPRQIWKAVEKVLRVEGIGIEEIDIWQHVRLGAPAAVIRQVAVDYGAMLVVVGTRNQGSVKRLVLGSVADDLVHDGHFPVLVAHANRLAELPKTEFPDEPMPEVDAEPHERPLGASVYRSSLISAWKSLGSPTSADFR